MQSSGISCREDAGCCPLTRQAQNTHVDGGNFTGLI